MAGFLTYSLMKKSDALRRIVAVEARSSSRIRDWLSAQELQGVEHLERLLLERRDRGLDLTGAAKSLAIDLIRGNVEIEGLDVAVHKFGIVPIYVVPETTVEVDCLDTPRECRIGIFASGLRSHDAPKDRIPVNALELLKSLQVEPELTFLRYVEDVGEYTDELIANGNWSDTFRLGRKIEDLVGASINSKIKTVHRYWDRTSGEEAHSTAEESREAPSLAEENRKALRNEARQVMEFHRELLWKIATARALVLFLLNELYRSVGLKHKDKYDDTYTNLWEEYFDQYDEAVAAREADSELQCLQDIWERWHLRDAPDALEALRSRSGSARHWILRLIEFAAFVSRIRRMDPNPSQTKLFISTRHTETMRKTRKKVEGIVARNYDDQVELVWVDEQSAGYHFAKEIEARIWLCDALLALYSEPASRKPAERDWTSYEVKLAINREMPVRVLLDLGATKEMVFAGVSREDPNAAQYLEERVILELPEAANSRSRTLRVTVLELAGLALDHKTVNTIRSFVCGTYPKSERVIAVIHRSSMQIQLESNDGALSGEWISVSDLARELRLTATALTRELKNIYNSRRELFFASDVSISPIRYHEEEGQCTGNLMAVMEILRPDLDARERQEKLLSIVAQFGA